MKSFISFTSFSITVSLVLLTLFSSSAEGLKPMVLRPYVLIMKPDVATAQNVEERVKSRSADPGLASFTAHVDSRSMFRSSPKLQGFRMTATEEAASQMRSDSDVLIVEEDSIIDLDMYMEPEIAIKP